ncbi:hypothetical protein TNCV_360951 [Trichonephila clavipes]|nr:hypothetical protein TNCV_360951 [Trichonephila clavipes]
MSFAISRNAGSALVENPSNLFVESYKTSPVLHVQDSPVPNSILMRLWVQTYIQKVQDMRRMQNGSKTSIQMVYEACLRAKATPSVAERLSLPERPAEPERIPTPSAQRPEKIPTPPVEPERPAEPLRMPPAEPQRIPPAEPEIPAEPERPPMEMVDPPVSVNTMEMTPPLITRCDKSTLTRVLRQFPPTFMSNAWILERGAWNNHRPIKDSNRNPRRFQTTLFCGCLEIILSRNWVTMDSLFNPPM